MKKIPKQKQIKDVQTHIDKAYELIDEFLPSDYVAKVKLLLPKNTPITTDIIRNVRRKKQSPHKHIAVLTLLLQVAKDNLKQIEQLSNSF